MKINFDLKKGTEVVSGVLQKTTEAGKKLSINVQEKAKDLSEKNKNENYLKKLKKYNPLFPDVFYSGSFNLPNIIVIVDDAVRKDIDVCEGAIGWLSNEKGTEVLHLYDEEVERCGIKFVPSVICDAYYYVDRFDRTRFIQTDCIFSKAYEERLAELKHIAYSLGAKKCSIEISESSLVSEDKNANLKINLPLEKIVAGLSGEGAFSKSEKITQKGIIEATFEGSDEVKMPQLKWFADDDTIKRLIEMRLENRNQLKTEIVELEGSVSATMSQKTACTIDGAIGTINAKGSVNMEGQAARENHSKLIYKVEF